MKGRSEALEGKENRGLRLTSNDRNYERLQKKGDAERPFSGITRKAFRFSRRYEVRPENALEEESAGVVVVCHCGCGWQSFLDLDDKRHNSLLLFLTFGDGGRRGGLFRRKMRRSLRRANITFYIYI